MQVCTVRMRMLEHVCAGVCRDADVRSYHLEQGTRNHSEVITVIFLSRGTRFANGEDGVDKNVVWGYFATQRQLLIRASQGEIIGWLNDRSVGDDERKGQFVLTSLLFTSSVNFTWRFLLLVSNLCEMCATHTLTFVCILVCVCVTRHPGASRSLLWPWSPSPVCSDHTHRHTIAVTLSWSWNPIAVASHTKLASTARLCFSFFFKCWGVYVFDSNNLLSALRWTKAQYNHVKGLNTYTLTLDWVVQRT